MNYIFKSDEGEVLGIYESDIKINIDFLTEYVKDMLIDQVRDIQRAEELINRSTFYQLTCSSIKNSLASLYPPCKKLSEFGDFEEYKDAWNYHMDQKAEYEKRIYRISQNYLDKMVKDGILVPVITEFEEIYV